MSSPSLALLLEVDLQPGKPPIVAVEAPGDAPSWAAEHRDALREVVAEHGSVLVRGLGLRNAAEISAVFRRLSTSLARLWSAVSGCATPPRPPRCSGGWPPP